MVDANDLGNPRRSRQMGVSRTLKYIHLEVLELDLPTTYAESAAYPLETFESPSGASTPTMLINNHRDATL